MGRGKGIVCWAFSQSCVALNALSSGGVFLFPLYVPWLKQHYSPTQSELSTIILAGMMGQYAFAVLWGAVIDSIGPHACSLAASALFLISWSAFAYLAANSLGSPAILAALFFTAGVGRVASYFSAIFASRSQKKSGLATSVPLALSGLSPLVLSYVAGLDVFQTPGGVFDVPKFVFWMGIGCTVIHAIGAIGLKHVDDLANEEGERARLMGVSEDEHVIEAQREAMKAGCMVVQKVESDGAVSALLKDCGFWGYVAIGIVITGTVSLQPCEWGCGSVSSIQHATCRPSITSVIWGARNLGRNFGILSYAPLIGTPVFTYVYAWTSGQGRDWRTMFVISASSAVAALVGCSMLWRRWSGRL
ncbi:hypothetical protein RSAG8_00070, partial [Rhizoctonia solani AG-8 WAC10335]